VPVLELRSLGEHVSKSGRRMRFVLIVLGIGAAMTLALGVIGLYGVIVYVINLRSREIGIRIALGLTPPRALGMILRQGEVVIAGGTAIGLVIFVAFARLLRSLTYGIGVVDGASLGVAAMIVFLVASLATWLPARRAARIDPAEALRNE
jgi:ABC-type antimicrobial peptide transport system permease subunit